MKFFRNEIPYGFWQAVCLLHREYSDSTRRILINFSREKPYIDIENYSGPYDSLSSRDSFILKDGVAEQLKNEELVTGEPYWGGRSSFKFLPTDNLDQYYYENIGPRFNWMHHHIEELHD